MKHTVYAVSGAPRAWRVLLGHAFKGIEYEIKYLEASQKEHKQPDFLEVNPRGTVPAITVDGRPMYDSIAILAWLDKAYPKTPLFGETANETAAIWQLTMDCCDYLRAAHHGVLSKVFSTEKTITQLETTERQAFDASVQQLISEYERLETIIGGQSFFCGDHPTAADAVIFPEARILQRATETKASIMEEIGLGDPDSLYPKVANWKKRIESLPGVEKTMPYHWAT